MKKKLFEDAITKSSNKVLTVDEVEKKIKNLYQLKHFGKKLEEIMKVSDNSHKNMYEFKENKHYVKPNQSQKFCVIQ